MGKINIVHPVSFYFCNIPFNINPPSTISPFTCSVPLNFPTKIWYVSLPVFCALLNLQIHRPWSDCPTNMQCTVQFMVLLTLRFLPSSCYYLPLKSEYSPQRFVLIHLRTVYRLISRDICSSYWSILRYSLACFYRKYHRHGAHSRTTNLDPTRLRFRT